MNRLDSFSLETLKLGAFAGAIQDKRITLHQPDFLLIDEFVRCNTRYRQ